MGLMHEFKEFINDSLEKLPMSLEESGVLANNVHNVACHHCLIILATLGFREAQKVLDDSDEKSFLCLFVHSTRYRADCPA